MGALSAVGQDIKLKDRVIRCYITYCQMVYVYT